MKGLLTRRGVQGGGVIVAHVVGGPPGSREPVAVVVLRLGAALGVPPGLGPVDGTEAPEKKEEREGQHGRLRR